MAKSAERIAVATRIEKSTYRWLQKQSESTGYPMGAIIRNLLLKAKAEAERHDASRHVDTRYD